jgi:hypothetical protein
MSAIGPGFIGYRSPSRDSNVKPPPKEPVAKVVQTVRHHPSTFSMSAKTASLTFRTFRDAKAFVGGVDLTWTERITIAPVSVA